jgi:hypothetical protein
LLLKILHQRILKERGDSFVSVLLAAGLLSGTAVVGGGVMKLMRKDQAYTTAMSTAIAAESAIMHALQSPATYANPAHNQAMRDGGTNLFSGTGIAINGERGLIGQGATLARIGNTVLLTRMGTACNGSQSNPIKEDFCAVATNVRIDCEAGGLCKAAYQVAINPAANDGVQVPPLGSQNWPPSASDFKTVISYDLYRRPGASLACASGELFVSAIDKSNGSVTCAKPALATLQPNQVPDGVVYNSLSNSLELRSRDLGQAACADSRYVLQTVDPRTLDQGASVNGTCVYRFKNDIPWMDPWPTGKDEVTMNVCPSADYDIVPDGTCQMDVIERTQGWCVKSCQDGNGFWYDCSEPIDPVINYHIEQDPAPGNRKNGPQVMCRLVQDGAQPCQASWKGQVRWSGRCQLNQPRYVPAVRR